MMASPPPRPRRRHRWRGHAGAQPPALSGELRRLVQQSVHDPAHRGL